MTAPSPLRIDVADLRRRFGEQRTVRQQVTPEEIRVADVGLDTASPVSVELVLESLAGGIEASGEVRGRWVGLCRRCLEPVSGPIVASVREMFEDSPTEGETYPIDREALELWPMVRDALAASLPLAPICRESCPGPDPDGHPLGVVGDGPPEGEPSTPPPKDPRWAALDVLLEGTADSEPEGPIG